LGPPQAQEGSSDGSLRQPPGGEHATVSSRGRDGVQATADLGKGGRDGGCE
jgi:hypothetical protein